MYYWVINGRGIKADTFEQACNKLGIDWRKAKVYSVC